jgi:hypothetical protein
MTGKQLRELQRIRNKILSHLDKTKWAWNWNLSLLLDQVDLLLREKE